MGRLAEEVERVQRNRGGANHLLEAFLPTIDPEDASDVVALLKKPGVDLGALAEQVAKLGLSVHKSSWENYRREARNGKFDQWAT